MNLLKIFMSDYVVYHMYLKLQFQYSDFNLLLKKYRCLSDKLMKTVSEPE